MPRFLRHPHLEIDVSPTEFVFRHDANVVRLPTVVQPDIGGGVRGFFMEGYTPPRHPLALFQPGGEAAQSRTEHLQAWLRLGITECQCGRRILLRPHATVHDAASLGAALLGYQYALLRRELLAAGARSALHRAPSSRPALGIRAARLCRCMIDPARARRAARRTRREVLPVVRVPA